MTPPRETQYNSHFVRPPATQLECCWQFLSVQHSAISGTVRKKFQHRARYSIVAQPGRVSAILRVLCGGDASWANQARGGSCRRDRTSEQLFILGAKIFRGSVSSSGRSGLTTRSPVSRSARNARSGMRASSLTASASRTPGQCTRSMVQSSTIEIQEYPRGVRYSSQGSLRIGRRHFGADDRSLAALSARLVSSALDPATGADTAAAPGLTDPPVAAVVNFRRAA